jgi:hypothetical protein
MRSHWAKDPASGQIRNPALRNAIFGLWKNEDNRPTPEQLQASCGKASDLAYLQQDLNDVVESYAQAKAIERGEKPAAAQTAAATAQAGAADLESGLSGLDDIDEILGGDAAAAPAAVKPVAGELEGLDEFTAHGQSDQASRTNGHAVATATVPDEDLFGEDAVPASEPAAARPEPAGVAAPAVQEGGGDAASFDQIWEEL